MRGTPNWEGFAKKIVSAPGALTVCSRKPGAFLERMVPKNQIRPYLPTQRVRGEVGLWDALRRHGDHETTDLHPKTANNHICTATTRGEPRNFV